MYNALVLADQFCTENKKSNYFREKLGEFFGVSISSPNICFDSRTSLSEFKRNLITFYEVGCKVFMVEFSMVIEYNNLLREMSVYLDGANADNLKRNLGIENFANVIGLLDSRQKDILDIYLEHVGIDKHNPMNTFIGRYNTNVSNPCDNANANSCGECESKYTKKRCAGVCLTGNRCKRNVKPGESRCMQHQ